MQLSDYSIHAFIQENNLKTETGQPIEFHDHRYLFDIYRDDSPNIVEEKAAQLGLTTMEIIRSFYRSYKKGLDIIYVLPTFTEVRDFSGGKVNRIVDQNPVFQEWVKDKDSIEQKRVGKSTIYYRGSWNERQALMISADWLILDEYDRSDQSVLEQYESRLQHSKYGYKAIFSNPSAPLVGVDLHFQRTDKKMWHITHSCGNQYVLDETCIDFVEEVYRCPTCKQEITDEERRMGDWIPTQKGEEGWSGYWIPLWVNPRVTAKVIAEHKRTKTADYFANFVAGRPYQGGDSRIPSSIVLKNCVDVVNSQESRVIIGVDTGLPIYYTLMNKEGVFYYGHCKEPSATYDPYDELEGFLKRFPKSILVSDQGGDLIGIRKLQAKYPGRVFLCWYRPDSKSTDLITWGEGDEYGKVIVDRHRAIQLLIVEQMREIGRIRLNGTPEEWQEWADQFNNIYREKIMVKESPNKDDRTLYGTTYVWKRNGPDHYVHTLLYAMVGLSKYAESMASIVGTDTLAEIPMGKMVSDQGYSPGYISNSQANL